MRPRPTMLAACTWACAFLLAACTASGSPPSTTDTSVAFTPTAAAPPDPAAMPGTPDDIAYAQLMIVHHQQAIQVADLAATRAASPELVSLAAVIAVEQTQEIATLTKWLSWWGAPTQLPGTATSGAASVGGEADGRLVDIDVAPLAELKGADFDQLWLPMMIAHHERAVELAGDWLALTRLPAPRAYETARADDHREEIRRMQRMQVPPTEQGE